MSTKAERKRKEQIKKKISLCVRIVLVIVLIIMGIVYYFGLDGEDEINDAADSYSITENSDSTGMKYVLENKSDNLNVSNNKTKSNPAVQENSYDDKNKSETESNTGLDDNLKTDAEADKDEIDKTGSNSGNINSLKSDNDNTEIGLEYNYKLADGKININTATAADLCKLNGIGEKRALDIIEYREKNGGFRKIEDIMKVKGIKQGIFSKIKDEISCG